MNLPLWIYPVMFCASFFAGLVDAIAGGGGLIILPALLALGLPPTVAIATNKVGAVCGTFTAAWHYNQRGLVDWRQCRLGFGLTLLGAAVGARTLQQIDNRVLAKLIPALLSLLILYMLFKPKVGEQDGAAKLNTTLFYL